MTKELAARYEQAANLGAIIALEKTLHFLIVNFPAAPSEPHPLQETLLTLQAAQRLSLAAYAATNQDLPR